MKPTLIKISISQDGLLPQQSIELGETLLQNFPKKLMSALDFEKVDSSGKKTTFIGIMPVFVVIGEKTQEIEIELTVTHPELRDKVVDIFTFKPPSGIPAETSKTEKPKPTPKSKPVVKAAKAQTVAKAKAVPKAAPKTKSSTKAKPVLKAGKTPAKSSAKNKVSAPKKKVPKGRGKK